MKPLTIKSQQNLNDDYDENIVKANIEDKKNFRVFASNKIEESLYNNKDIIHKLTN